jgi:NADH:ubiquinone reductase (H+-translocating)
MSWRRSPVHRRAPESGSVPVTRDQSHRYEVADVRLEQSFDIRASQRADQRVQEQHATERQYSNDRRSEQHAEQPERRGHQGGEHSREQHHRAEHRRDDRRPRAGGHAAGNSQRGPKAIVIVGGGYAGFYAAWGLEKRLRRGEATITVIDPAPYMTYQPFIPEVAAGSIEARHAIVPLRRHLRRTHVVSGRAISIDHAARRVHVLMPDGVTVKVSYDEVVVTAGAVSRVFPVPGVAQSAIGMKRIEEAVAIRDAIFTAFDEAAVLPHGPERQRRLTVTFIGGGFAGVEGFGEVLSLAHALLRYHHGIRADELRFHLVDASDHLLPEVSPPAREWVRRHFETCGSTVHLSTTVVSAVDGHVVLSSGETFESGLVVWTAGITANPVVARHTDLPVNEKGLVVVRPDLRIGTVENPVDHAWAAGDDAAVPDLPRGSGYYTVPNAQHAVRQGRLLAKNIVAVLRGRRPRPYRHRSLGTIATLGLGRGIFQSGPITIKGFPAWVIHRGYHVLSVPTWERKIRVSIGWFSALFLGRDIASLEAVQRPRAAFQDDADTRRSA